MRCPSCGSDVLYKDGLRYTGLGSLQRWLCRSCGYRFSERQQSLNNLSDDNKHRQICVLEAKNLATATEIKTVAGEKGKLLDYAWRLKKRGLAEKTIEARTYRLNILLSKGADLRDTDSVETVLATEKLTNCSKREFVAAYRSFTRTFDIAWTPIRVRYQPKQPFIPLESELDQLIASFGKRTATFLQALKDTGARAGEVCKLKWTDVNEKNSTVSINAPEKGSNSRVIKVSAKTISMINALDKVHGEYIFSPRREGIYDTFAQKRNRLAIRLQNPRLKQIHFHSFRHWKATMLYHQTRNILYVKYVLGHKRLENTEIYTHLIEFETDEYDSATAKNIEEARQLIEDGFEYVTDMEGVKLFRKRK